MTVSFLEMLTFYVDLRENYTIRNKKRGKHTRKLHNVYWSISHRIVVSNCFLRALITRKRHFDDKKKPSYSSLSTFKMLECLRHKWKRQNCLLSKAPTLFLSISLQWKTFAFCIKTFFHFPLLSFSLQPSFNLFTLAKSLCVRKKVYWLKIWGNLLQMLCNFEHFFVKSENWKDLKNLINFHCEECEKPSWVPYWRNFRVDL